MNVAEQEKNRSRSHQRLIYTKEERCTKEKRKENKRKQKKTKKRIKTKPDNPSPTRGIEPRSPA